MKNYNSKKVKQIKSKKMKTDKWEMKACLIKTVVLEN